MKPLLLALLAVVSICVVASNANAAYCYSEYTDCLGTVRHAEGDCPDCSHPPKSTEGCNYADTPGPGGCIKSRKVVCGNGCKGV